MKLSNSILLTLEPNKQTVFHPHVIFDESLVVQIVEKILYILDSHKYKVFLQYEFEYAPKIYV